MMMKIVCWFQKKKKCLINLQIKRLDEKTKLDEKVNLDNLIYRYKVKTTDAKFDEFDNAFNLLDKIRNGETTLADVKSDKIKFKSDLGKIKKDIKNRSKELKKSTVQYWNSLQSKEQCYYFFDVYSLLASKAENQAKKQSTKNQATKNQIIALAQVKAGNNSESVLNEIKQIIYSFYQLEEVTKKVYNKIIKSIQI